MTNAGIADRIDRATLIRRYRGNRRRSVQLFNLVRAAMYDRPLELRHPFIFYLGHIPAFHFNTLAKRAYGLPAFHEAFDELFRRGIDPDSQSVAELSRSAWPDVAEVTAYANRVDAEVEHLLGTAPLENAENPYLDRVQAIYTILEHEEMHQETLLYIMNRLDDARKTCDGIAPAVTPNSRAEARRIVIPAGRVMLGADRDTVAFGWDNEFDATHVEVAAFALESLPVTNARFLAFVAAGGTPPASWIATSTGWQQRTMFGVAPLQASWPAYVSLESAQAFARAAGARIMTESEFHRAAFGDVDGTIRSMPWGDASPTQAHGNFGFRRFDPEPVGESPLGASAWGVQELVGNGWEWTATHFGPLPGFQPMASYPEYSADFFDGKHAVLKGASPVTSTTLLRSSLRNWFRSDYPYAFTKFRLAFDI